MGIKGTTFSSQHEKTDNQQRDIVFWMKREKGKKGKRKYLTKIEGKIKARYHKDSTTLNQSLNYFEGNLWWFTVQDILQVDNFLCCFRLLTTRPEDNCVSYLYFHITIYVVHRYFEDHSRGKIHSVHSKLTKKIKKGYSLKKFVIINFCFN